MKTVLKLVIAVVFLNAAIRGADAAWNYYQLRDGAEQALLFGSQSTSAELHDQIMSIANDLNIPLDAENLTVRRQGLRTVAEGSYTQSIEFFPRYRYPVQFSFVVNAPSVGTPPPDEPPRRKK